MRDFAEKHLRRIGAGVDADGICPSNLPNKLSATATAALGFPTGPRFRTPRR